MQKRSSNMRSKLGYGKTSVATFLCTFQCSVVNNLYNIYPSDVNCGLKREYAGEALREVPRQPSGNSKFVRVLVDRGYSTRFTPSPNQGSSESHIWHTGQPSFSFICNHKRLHYGCHLNGQFQFPESTDRNSKI